MTATKNRLRESHAERLRCIAEAEALHAALMVTRTSLRHASQPGDPAREERLQHALADQAEGMRKVKRLMGLYRWDDTLLNRDEAERLWSASEDLSRDRRQLKKMRRVVT